MTKHFSDTTQIDLPSDLLIKAQGRARSLGMTLSEYMQSLVDKDVKTKEQVDPWREPIPTEVAERWSRELAETEAEELRTGKPRKTYYSPEEFIEDMQDNT